MFLAVLLSARNSEIRKVGELKLETIREIISFSHDGYGHMWYPFAVELEDNNTTISAEYFFEVGDLISLIRYMFSTNNHTPDIMSKRNSKQSRKRLIGTDKKTQCSIQFRTDNNEYILRRCFMEQYSTESRLQKIGSTVIYKGHDVIQMLSKFKKPIIIDDRGLFSNGSVIFKPLDNYSRSCMIALSNNWAKMIGLKNSRIGLDYEGRWSVKGDYNLFSRGHSKRERVPSTLRLLANLAQTVMKKRTYGLCPPIFSPFDMDSLSEFESIALIDLIKNVCREEGLQFILVINTTLITNSMIGAIETPRLSVYEQ